MKNENLKPSDVIAFRGVTMADLSLLVPSQSDKKKIFIITGSSWNNYVHHISVAESTGYIVTNTPMAAHFPEQMYQADCVVYLKGWAETALGRKMNEYRKQTQKPIVKRPDVFYYMEE